MYLDVSNLRVLFLVSSIGLSDLSRISEIELKVSRLHRLCLCKPRFAES